MASPAVEEIRAASYVGFDSITRQIEHKLLKRGFQFNVIVVGSFHFSLCVLKAASFMIVVQDKLDLEKAPSSTLFLLRTLWNRKEDWNMMNPSGRPRKFRRFLMVKLRYRVTPKAYAE
jgi:hypothetical protein